MSRKVLRSSTRELDLLKCAMLMAVTAGLPPLALPSISLARDDLPPPERIALWTGQAPVGNGKFASTNAFITVHRPASPNGAAVVICPGGGYGALVTEPEGTGIARWLNRQGIVGIVLEYRLPGGNAFVPLLDGIEPIASNILALRRGKKL